MSVVNVVAVSGNPGSPSRTKVLVDTILDELEKHLSIERTVIELADAGPLLGQSHHRKQLARLAEQRIATVEAADLLVVASPVYRGSYTGLFKHLFDLVGMEALVGVPVILAATGGSDRHALVIDHQLRPLFSFFRANTVPTGIYATEADFEQYRLVSNNVRERVGLAAEEAAQLASLRGSAGPSRQRAAA
jgi:FMN reductase